MLDAASSVPLERIKLTDPVWAPRQAANRRETLTAIYKACREAGRMRDLELGWRPGEPTPPVYGESELAKWLEAACLAYRDQHSSALLAMIDEVADLFVRAQGPDGYIGVYYSAVRPEGRFRNLREGRELYNAGHIIEAGIAHFHATRDRRLFDACRRYADLLADVFGPGPGQTRGYPGHPGVELALLRLAEVAGEPRYRDLAGFFLEERGRAPNHFLAEIEAARARGGGDPDGLPVFAPERYHADQPIRQRLDLAGDSAGLMRLYAGVAEYAKETGDAQLARCCRRLWEGLERRVYITGAVGAADGSLGADYELPSAGGRTETCAAIGLVEFIDSLFGLDPRAEYLDLQERALYNAVAAAVALDGRHFFSGNPLQAPDRKASEAGTTRRLPWFERACCPTNIARFIPRIGSLVYGVGADKLWCRHYVDCLASLNILGTLVEIRQQTRYPWDESVLLTLEPSKPLRFTLVLRAPGWMRPGTGGLAINGARAPFSVRRGFIHIQREWRAGDRVEWRMPMPVERVYARPELAEACGRVALTRGPVVYCFEEKLNGSNLAALSLPRGAEVSHRFSRRRLGGVVCLHAKGHRIVAAGPEAPLYRALSPKCRVASLIGVPYAAWSNSGVGGMTVWLREG